VKINVRVTAEKPHELKKYKPVVLQSLLRTCTVRPPATVMGENYTLDNAICNTCRWCGNKF